MLIYNQSKEVESDTGCLRITINPFSTNIPLLYPPLNIMGFRYFIRLTYRKVFFLKYLTRTAARMLMFRINQSNTQRITYCTSLRADNAEDFIESFIKKVFHLSVSVIISYKVMLSSIT